MLRLLFVPTFCIALLAAGCGFELTDHQIYEVDHYQVPCMGVQTQSCLRVRPEGEDNFELNYSGIQGFSHDWGHRYELEVAVEEIDEPHQDASSVQYEMVEILSQQPVEPGEEFSLFIDHPPEGNPAMLTIEDDEPRGGIYAGPGYRCDDESHCDEIRQLVADEIDFTATFAYGDDVNGRVIVTDIDPAD